MWLVPVCVCLFFFGGTNSDFFPSRKIMGNFWIFFLGCSSVDFIDFTILLRKNRQISYIIKLGEKKNLFMKFENTFSKRNLSHYFLN